MTPQDIGIELTAITTALIEKTGEQPWLDIAVKVEGDGKCHIVLYRGHNHGDYRIGTATGETFEGVFAEARNIITNIPSEKERALDDLQKGLAKLIDKAHESGVVDDEYIAPLRTTREALTENLLTFQGEGK